MTANTNKIDSIYTRGIYPTNTSDALLNVKAAAKMLDISVPSFWRAVGSKFLPCPYYPSPRCPRWRAAELLAAVEKTRALPAEKKIARRNLRKNASAA